LVGLALLGVCASLTFHAFFHSRQETLLSDDASAAAAMAPVPTEPRKELSLESLDYAFLKRAFDLVFSSSVLVFLSPLLLLIALGVKLSSPGPIVFRQERVGLNGKTFMMYKFRTMRTSSLAVSDTGWTKPQDRRVTPLGRFLRRSSLDELPQLLNVFKGDMSMVGPRPERPHFVEIFKREVPDYMLRHYMKCGITGWAQVNGWRGDTSIRKRIEYDLYYMQHWALWFDIKILFLTLARGLCHRNAY
jgi:exopolysaccharide biosynthesis polyprenyl glycosylphosphotransferase